MKSVLLVTRPISPPWDEASKNFAYFVAKNLKGVEVNLMTKGILPDLPENVKQNPVYTTSEIAEFNLEQKLRSLYFQFTSRNNFDVAHYFFTPTKLNSFLIKNFLSSQKTKRIQTVATLREDLWSDQDLKNLLFADLIITYSEYAKQRLENIGFKNVIRIYPGIDLKKYEPEAKNLETLSYFKIQESEFVIIYPGEYTRLGCTDDIVASLPSLFEKIPNAKFIFANRVKNEKDAKKKAEIIKELRDKKIIDRVAFTDTYGDMPKVYNMADVVVFPVRDMKGKFDVPLAVIEAMACEKPVLISDLPILKEFATQDNSVIMKAGDRIEFVEKLVELYQSKDHRKLIGSNARNYVIENFDINKVAQQYEEVYKNITQD